MPMASKDGSKSESRAKAIPTDELVFYTGRGSIV